MNTIEQKRRTLQQTMSFAAALSSGIEQVVGRGANSMTYAAGRKLGKQFASEASPTQDLEQALEEIRRVLEANNCLWKFETFQPRTQSAAVMPTAGGGSELRLVFRDCMIRQALFCFGHPQKGSLCSMMYGFFSGALETITGRRSTLEIIHAGENACLKRLSIEA